MMLPGAQIKKSLPAGAPRPYTSGAAFCLKSKA